MIFLAAAGAVTSCTSKTDSDTSSNADSSVVTCEDGKVLVDGKCGDPASAWMEIKTGGSTTCMHGDPYSFFVHMGNPDKVLIYFAFGGFCYNAKLCAASALNYVPKINVDPTSLSTTSGIFDLKRDDNPFKDWSWVYVPECTADFEWGDNVASYPAMGSSPAVTVQHKGFVNVSAVRDWVYGKFDKPSKIFVTGSSGGADAALMHYSYLRQHYTAVKDWVYLADSSFGVVTESFLTDAVESWGAYKNRPTWIPAINDATPVQMTWDFVEKAGADYYKDGAMAEFGSAYDTLESITYELMGGKKEGWHDKMEAHLDNVSSQIPQFRYLIVPGTGHIVLNQPTFYDYEADGTSLRDWVADLAIGKDVQSTQCKDNCMVLPDLPSASSGGGVSEVGITCLGSSMCNPGSICCAALASQSTACVMGNSCPLGNIQMCQSDTDCGGNTCTPVSLMGISLGTCGGLGG
jgi:hypothetical protein